MYSTRLRLHLIASIRPYWPVQQKLQGQKNIRTCCAGHGSDKVTTNSSSSRKLKKDGPSLQDFLKHSAEELRPVEIGEEDTVPYLNENDVWGGRRKVYFETYGCQMNVSDTEIAWSVLKDSGYQRTESVNDADVILAVTCAIRENAEQKIWTRLQQFRAMKTRRGKNRPLKVGVLGCMAERLKKDLLEREKSVDLIAGPDAYRDLPRLLSLTSSGQRAANVVLSLEETYADVMPVRMNAGAPTAFVSIMRGCDNMCSYCIVPFTRGRERSRPIRSILEEVRALSGQGVKEVTLLGQNVNSYRDMSEQQHQLADRPTNLSAGFGTIYRNKKGGLRFSALLDRVSQVDPEMRVRFVSPHPKDFPDEVLQLIRDRRNICSQLHLPAQSGSSQVLQRMRRNHTREAYLELVQHVREVIPDVSLSSDFIVGFCGETEDDHLQTLSLARQVRYDNAYLFAYSMRKKTHAYHKLEDDMPADVKQRRLAELIDVCRQGMAEANAEKIGQVHLVLVEGLSKKSPSDLAGRNDGNTKVIIPNMDIPEEVGGQKCAPMKAGDYVAVKITSSTSQVLKGLPLAHTSLQGFPNLEWQGQRAANSA
ncbi:mitochondrial tRNA methylthiotransferase CDK5RAP1-like [Branchiostoma floridae x Branchiostoma belcheri]